MRLLKDLNICALVFLDRDHDIDEFEKECSNPEFEKECSPQIQVNCRANSVSSIHCSMNDESYSHDSTLTKELNITDWCCSGCTGSMMA